METRDIDTFNRMDINGATNCFFRKKDNNEDFMSNPIVRLINLRKNNWGE